jgi:hypothetical protein
MHFWLAGKYNDEEYEFLKAHNQQLVNDGIAFVNYNSV